MEKIARSIAVAAPASAAFEFLADPANLPGIWPSMVETTHREVRPDGGHRFDWAYRMAGIQNPAEELNFIELHDAYSSSEIQTYEDLGLCRYGEGGSFVDKGCPFMPGIDYGLDFPVRPERHIPVNPSGGLLACGHPVGATGLM